MSLVQYKIGGAREAHRVKSADEYKRRALEVMRDVAIATGHATPGLTEGQRLHAYVSGGWWVVKCTCGNAPAAEHEWKIAVCFECGAVHTPVFPRDRAEGEAALLKRENRHNRHWFPHASTHGQLGGEKVGDLHRENAVRGVG